MCRPLTGPPLPTSVISPVALVEMGCKQSWGQSPLCQTGWTLDNHRTFIITLCSVTLVRVDAKQPIIAAGVREREKE